MRRHRIHVGRPWGAVALALFLAGFTVTLADPPNLMRYQARLTSGAGTPIAGNHSFTFSIYSQVTGGTALWTEGPRTIQVPSGDLNVLLGEVTPIPSSVMNQSDRWLEIVVDGTSLAPRNRLSSVPYSFAADRIGTKTLGEMQSDNDSRYPGLNNANTFAGNQHVNGDLSATGRGSFQGGTNDHLMDVMQSGTGSALRATAGSVGAHGVATGANGAGVKGEATGAGGSGVHGSAADGAGAGVKGENAAANGVGVKGEGMGAGGVGVRGDATDGSGVHGNATGAQGVGARGSSSGANGAGVKGEATGAGGSGVHGSAADVTGAGVKGENVGANGVGVKGEGMGAGGVGVRGDATDGSGVHGNATGAQGVGARGSSSGANGAGVKGEATGAGGSGVHGSAADGAGAGVKGENAAANGVGVKGEGTGAGGVGVRGDATDGSGVHGNATGAQGVGARGSSSGASGAGVKGEASGAGGSGVHGEATGTGAGVMGKAENAGGTAGLFDNTAGGKLLSGQVGGAEKFAVDGDGNVNAVGAVEAAGRVRGGQVHSLAAEGTAPLVVGSTTQVLNLNCDLLDGVSAADLAPSTGSTVYAPATGSTAYVSRTGDTLSGALVLPADGLTAGANQLVLAGGMVGIGTATPGVSLDVNGTTRASTVAAMIFTSAAAGQTVQVTAPSGSPGANVTVQGGGGASSGNGGGDVTIQGGAGNGVGLGGNILLLPGTGGSPGNVGIGTPTPGATLDVNGTARAATMAAGAFTSAAPGQAVQVTAPSGSPGADVTIQGGDGVSMGNWGGSVTIQGGTGSGTGVGGHIFLLPGSGGGPGNVGIGTMMPGATLDVNGTARTATMAASTFTSRGAGEDVLVQGPPGANVTVQGGGGAMGNAGGNVTIQGGSGGGFGAGGNIVLLPGTGGSPGNVGIGTMMPGATLDVNGTTRAAIMAAATFTSASENEDVLVRGPSGSPGRNITLSAGSGALSGDAGGNVKIEAGNGNGPGANGDIILVPGFGGTSGFLSRVFVDGSLDVKGPVKVTTLQGEDESTLLEIKARAGDPPGELALRGGDASGGAGDGGGNITIYPGRGNAPSRPNGDVIIDLGIGEQDFLQGKIGINVAAPENILTVQQGSATDPIADQWTTYSSRRWKTNIEPIHNALEMVLRLRGVSFDWKESGDSDLGLIAEEVGEVLPGIVQYEENGVDARGLDYSRLVPLLVEAIKAQQGEIEKLKEKLRSLGSR